MPIVCLSIQNQAKKKENLQTGYIDVEWTMIFKYKKQKKKNMICTKKKKERNKNTAEVVTQRQKPTGKFHH